jgi:hypothetical protein
VVVHNLHGIGISSGPLEADAPLIIDSNAVLTPSIALQFLEPIRRRDPQLFKRDRCVQDDQLSEGGPMQIAGKTPRRFPLEETLGVFAAEVLDHHRQ